METLCIIGLGYVGLPLAHAFAKKGYPVLGYDISKDRIAELSAGHDRTQELSDEQLKKVSIRFSADPSIIIEADIIIMAIPTPVDDNNKPDLSMVENATRTVGKHLKKGAIVVYESTVYPGVTEDICGALLEEESGLTRGEDFTLGYSPERINPGDKEHTVDKIMKIVAGEDEKTLKKLSALYGSVVTAGIHEVSSIKVAEMAKAIENAQRDLNIAFVNEIALLCNRIGIPTKEVLKAAGTKWNFLGFKPGLVGGHCIGVDPYYLVEKAEQLGMKTHVIAAGRLINDSMGFYVASQVLEALGDRKTGAKVLVLGLTFKENIPDTRNSKAKDVVKHLSIAGCDVVAHDPFVSDEELHRQQIPHGALEDGPFDAIVFLVSHKEYLDLGTKGLMKSLKPGGVIYDLKSLLDEEEVTKAGGKYLAL